MSYNYKIVYIRDSKTLDRVSLWYVKYNNSSEYIWQKESNINSVMWSSSLLCRNEQISLFNRVVNPWNNGIPNAD